MHSSRCGLWYRRLKTTIEVETEHERVLASQTWESIPQGPIREPQPSLLRKEMGEYKVSAPKPEQISDFSRVRIQELEVAKKKRISRASEIKRNIQTRGGGRRGSKVRMASQRNGGRIVLSEHENKVDVVKSGILPALKEQGGLDEEPARGAGTNPEDHIPGLAPGSHDQVDQLQPSLTDLLERQEPAQLSLGEWLSTGEVHDRLSAYYSLPGTATVPLSISSLMPRTELYLPSNAPSEYSPSLLFTEMTPTESSVSTGLASWFSGVPLLEEIDGVLERRAQHRSPLECAFSFLSCSYTSSDQEEWRTHCLSHFMGHQPPKTVQCPLCDGFRATCSHGVDAWNARMDHVYFNHHLKGQTLENSRPDFLLFRHLFQQRIIGKAEFEKLKVEPHRLTAPPRLNRQSGFGKYLASGPSARDD